MVQETWNLVVTIWRNRLKIGKEGNVVESRSQNRVYLYKEENMIKRAKNVATSWDKGKDNKCSHWIVSNFPMK